MRKVMSIFLALFVTVLPYFAKAGELSAEDKNYFKEITAEWEWAYGPHEAWDYRTLGLFCQLYKNYPNAEHEVTMAMLPTIPDSSNNVSCENAITIAKDFLTGYNTKITSDYLETLMIGTRFLNLNSYIDTTSSARCERMWIIKFYEHINSNEYLMRCDCYIDAETGKVFMIDLNLNGKTPEDFDNYQVIEIE